MGAESNPMANERSPIDPGDLRKALGQFCTGVVVVTGCVEGKPMGFAAQSFVSLSLDPALVGISPARTSASWPEIRRSGHFCINILTQAQKDVCDTFARSAGRAGRTGRTGRAESAGSAGIPDGDKFSGLVWQGGETGSPILQDVLAWVDCRIEAEHPAGDHTFVIGAVENLEVCAPEAKPLLFFQGRYGGFMEHEAD